MFGVVSINCCSQPRSPNCYQLVQPLQNCCFQSRSPNCYQLLLLLLVSWPPIGFLTLSINVGLLLLAVMIWLMVVAGADHVLAGSKINWVDCTQDLISGDWFCLAITGGGVDRVVWCPLGYGLVAVLITVVCDFVGKCKTLSDLEKILITSSLCL